MPKNITHIITRNIALHRMHRPVIILHIVHSRFAQHCIAHYTALSCLDRRRTPSHYIDLHCPLREASPSSVAGRRSSSPIGMLHQPHDTALPAPYSTRIASHSRTYSKCPPTRLALHRIASHAYTWRRIAHCMGLHTYASASAFA